MHYLSISDTICRYLSRWTAFNVSNLHLWQKSPWTNVKWYYIFRFLSVIKSLFQSFDQFVKPVQFIIYCTIQLSSSRLIRSAPWPLGWLYLPSLLPGSLFRTSVSLSCAMPDGRGLGPRTAVQIPCLLCGACPRSSWFHFIIGLVRYSIFLLDFGTSE